MVVIYIWLFYCWLSILLDGLKKVEESFKVTETNSVEYRFLATDLSPTGTRQFAAMASCDIGAGIAFTIEDPPR